MEIKPGEKLGPYEILSSIGEGGMGEVWKARDTRLDRIVAIKRLKQEYSGRFERESRAIAALNHPHICQIHDVGPDYLVLEYVEGKPLHGPMPVADAVAAALQIAGALEAAHARGILHRDIKPGNILMSATGPKLLDFGLAKVASEIDATTFALAGTPLYMSPEQAEGKPLDVRSDIFSLGVVLYEILAGRRAFDTLAAVLRDEPAALESPVAGIVKRCMSKDPGARFQSMPELRAALGKIAIESVNPQPSIAVLPFANMSADKEHEYFSDGLAEEIINALAQVAGLKVIARTSAFAFKGQNIDIRRIAEALGVANILEGSVRKAGNRIRVTAQLITAADGSHLWSERYDRDVTDVFAVQDEIATAITGVLEAKLAPKTGGLKPHTPNVAAYEAFLKGRHYQWNEHTVAGLLKSREFYQQAISLDPSYAMPYAALAEYFHIAGSFTMAPSEAIARGREAARHALLLDPAMPEAHAWLGIFAIVYDYDWKEAGQRFRLATAREPVVAYIRHLYGYFYLRLTGRADEAVEEHRLALEEDPLNLIIRVGMAVSLRAAGKDTEAAEEARRILDLNPRFFPAYNLQALDYSIVPAKEALAYAENGVELSPSSHINLGLLAGLLSRCGDTMRADRLVRSLRDGQNPRGPAGLAIFHFVRGEIEEGAESTIGAIEQRDQMVAMILLSPPYGPMLRASSRWPRLAKMMNLPETV
jgi:eukaryotic-like serine/threonine-protein kinase